MRTAKAAAETADKLKSEFLATMSHELRTPLNVLLGYVELLRDGAFGKLSPHQDKIIERMEQNARVLSDLITMVLDLNRLEAGGVPVVVKDVRLRNLLQEIREEMQGLCDQSGLTFVWKVEEELTVLQTDPGKLKVVLKNLIGNAIKFTKEGSVTIEAHPSANGVAIKVIDTGIGIPPDAHSLIFEPFRQVDNSDTRSYPGSGLGLNIVKRLLELLQGAITLDSEVGKGSTFRVWIPLSIAPREEEASTGEETP